MSTCQIKTNLLFSFVGSTSTTVDKGFLNTKTLYSGCCCRGKVLGST